jgi:hypothetical protein
MPPHTVQEALERAPQGTPPPAPGSRRKRAASVLRVSWRILRHWRPTRGQRPPEMHAIDYLAKDHPKAFV